LSCTYLHWKLFSLKCYGKKMHQTVVFI
jgi:hypothetical protein